MVSVALKLEEPRSPWAIRLVRDARLRGWLIQIAVSSLLLLLLGGLAWVAAGNLARQGIATGYDFLSRPARFEIDETVLPYSGRDTYAWALFIGFLNTLKVSLAAIVIATLVGTLVGIARLSSNKLLSAVAGFYVEGLRNVPLLLQLSFWYGMLTISLPSPRGALNPLDGVFLSNRGLLFPSVSLAPATPTILAALAVGCVGAILISRWFRRRQDATGQRPRLSAILAFPVALPLVAWIVSGAPSVVEFPQLRGFNFQGGLRLSPEFGALLLGLSAYSSAFVAETVRGGILAIGKGQSEAARALGFSNGLVMRLIVLPQALRVIIPPLTSQYLNLVKNSSLGVAIAYPDLVAIGNITMNQTGQAIEVVSIFMIVYLSISLTISAFMNWYNARMALVTR